MSGVSFMEKLLDGVSVEWKALGELCIPTQERGNEKQPVGQLPWGHNLVLLSKLKTQAERQWYAAKTIERELQGGEA
jgi:hypothetical protein